MVATRAVKRAVAESRNPLQHKGLREHIFSFVGAGHWWFVAQVSRAWKMSYKGVEDFRMKGIRDDEHCFTCTAIMTLTQAAFSSAACCSLATDSNINGGLCLDSSDWCLQRIAGQFSDLDTLQLALDRGLPANDHAIRGAAESGSPSKVQWLYERQDHAKLTGIGTWAAYGGNLELLNWLTKHGYTFGEVTCIRAAAAGHEHVLRYLRAQGCKWSVAITAAAVRHGHLALLKWLLSAGCPLNNFTLSENAATSGSIEMMVYARQRGCAPDATTLQAAASRGRLSMCQYLHSEGCAWNAAAPKWAAFFGHLDTLRWLHEHGCPWTAAEVCTEAAEGGRIEVMQYLLEEVALATPELLQHMLNSAGALDQLAAAQWLRQQGADWPAVLQHNVFAWDGECLTWARQQGCTAPGYDYDEDDFSDDDM
jgi:hypothetical protein